MGAAHDVLVVGHDDDGAALFDEGAHNLVHGGAAVGVQAFRRLVDHRQRAVGRECAGQAEPPPRALGQAPAVVDHGRLETLRAFIQEPPQADRVDDAVEVRGLDIGGVDLEVFLDRRVQQGRFLRHVDDLAAPPFKGHLLDIQAVDQDLPAVRLQQAQDDAAQGRLAAAVVADHQQHVAGRQFQVQGFEQRHGRALEPEGQVAQFDGAGILGDGGPFFRFQRHLDQLGEHGQRLARLGEGAAQLRQLGHRLQRPRRQDVGADHRTHVHVAADDQKGARGDDGDAHQTVGGLRDGLDHALAGRHVAAQALRRMDVLFPGPAQEAAGVEGAHQVLFAGRRAQKRAADTGRVLQFRRLFLHGYGTVDAEREHPDQEGQHHHRHQRMQQVEHEHENQGKRHIQDGRDVGRRIGLFDRGHAVDHFAPGFRRNLFQVAGPGAGQDAVAGDGQLFIRFHIDAAGEGAARLTEQIFQNDGQQHARRQGRQRRVHALADVAVQHLHDEQGAGHGQDVDEQGRDDQFRRDRRSGEDPFQQFLHARSLVCPRKPPDFRAVPYPATEAPPPYHIGDNRGDPGEIIGWSGE